MKVVEQIVSGKMPPDGPRLPDAEIQVFVDWINQQKVQDGVIQQEHGDEHEDAHEEIDVDHDGEDEHDDMDAEHDGEDEHEDEDEHEEMDVEHNGEDEHDEHDDDDDDN